MLNARAASSAPTQAAVKSRMAGMAGMGGMAGMAGMGRPGIVLIEKSTLTESCTEF
jgi:hypothetical protein